MNHLQVVQENRAESDTEPARIWREQPISGEWLFWSADERGCEGWFLRLSVTGLYPRRVGPFRSKAAAVATLESFINMVEVEVLCDLQNAMDGDTVYVIEGIPTLRAGQTAGDGGRVTP